MRIYNPISFVPVTVTVVTAVVYLVVLISLVTNHENVPAAPLNPTSFSGLNLSEAWQDLRILSKYYHPFNSRKNDDVRNWLLRRIDEILTANGVEYTTESSAYSNTRHNARPVIEEKTDHGEYEDYQQARFGDPLWRNSSPAVTVFNDLSSNYTTTLLPRSFQKGSYHATSTYFEGSNIIVYVRGTEDEEDEWWKSDWYSRKKMHGKGGVMVNTHFDSVSTSFGATDAGVGVVTELQLIKYFTTEGHVPKKGFVALLNNNEEAGLYGGKAFFTHPMASFVHTFLNLEGAGAGGRAILFRSTDTEVTSAYAHAKHPLGTVMGNDAYALGLVRSETDYSSFKLEGYRGLDLAFWHPRSKYHTAEDDAKHTSKDSVWDMLSASVETVKALSSDTSNKFIGPTREGSQSRVTNGQGSKGVWFDFYGSTMAVFQLRTLFAWSLTILVASPLMLVLISYLLVRCDKYYLFSGSIKSEGETTEAIPLGGWRGFSRFPIAIIISSTLTIGLSFLMRKVNPLLIYSSPYSVWAMSLSLFFFSYWFIMAGCNFVRPSALHRAYVLIWMFIFGWIMLVAATVLEDRYKLSSGYLIVFYEAAIFFAAVISLCEMFALPSKASIAKASYQDDETRDAPDAVPSSEALIAPDADEQDNTGHGQHNEPTETTSLLGSRETREASFATTFNRYRKSISQATAGEREDQTEKQGFFGNEQKWSAKLPSWAWIIQFLILGPFILMLVGNVGLIFVKACNQTQGDGSSILLPYLLVAIFSILIVLPIAPFAHRVTHHVPTLLFVVFIFTLLYNLTTFPFTSESRFKAFFQQAVDLDTGNNIVTLAGLEEYVLQMIAALPSSAGQNVTCEARPHMRLGVSFCSWSGIPPEVIDEAKEGIPPEKYYDDWLSYSIARKPSENRARFLISGRETRACLLRFDEPVSNFHVDGAAENDGRWNDVPEGGSDEIKLWSRDWNRTWNLDVEWHVSEGKKVGEEGRTGRVACLWDDHNGPGIIPALDEVMGYGPLWSTVTKMTDGLVEGSKRFVV